MHRFFRPHLLALAAFASTTQLLLAQLNIVINPGPGLSANAPALAAFNRAAAEWSARLSDPITVNISADLAAFGNPNVIGSASNVSLVGSYDLIRNAIVGDAANETDDSIVAFLPTSATFTANLRAGTSFNGGILAAKANLKALGFTGLDAIAGTTNDATITFNQAFSFDYDRSNGVSPGTIDFQTVATHEIGHALGFVSAVDFSDGGATTYPVQPLDLFRFGLAAMPTDATQFATLARELRPGFEAVTSDTMNNYRMSTGQMMGDGRQASHWKDDALGFTNIGVLDPTLSSGVFFEPSEADLRAFDLIGYEFAVVPEPGTLALVAVAGPLVWLLRRRRRVA